MPDFLLEERIRLADLDEQVKRHEHETGILKKLQGQAEQAERDIAREREQLLREVEAEREALNLEFDAEHAALKKERRRLAQNAERHRQQLAEDREAMEEKRQLRERADQLEEEMREKEKRWQRTTDRLQRQVTDLTRKNQELEEEVKRAGKQAQQATALDSRRAYSAAAPTSRLGGRHPIAPLSKRLQRGSSAGSLQRLGQSQGQADATPEVPPTRASEAWGSRLGNDGAIEARAGRVGDRSTATGSTAWTTASGRSNQQDGDARIVADRYGRVLVSRGETPGHSYRSGNSLSTPDLAKQEFSQVQTDPSTDIVDIKSVEGRTEHFFKDGRREIKFPNGLKKIIHPDGRTQVLFQNGDEKELHPDGTVVYQYGATGAVQTTLPDGCELYAFADGQSETHRPDGAKEIKFPNGTTKSVDPDGSETVTFPDGSVRLA